MVSGLIASFKSDSSLEFESLTVKENFEDLRFRNKYGFDLGWYTFGENIHIILMRDYKGETQIYLADSKVESESVMNEIIHKTVTRFSVDTNDEKAIFERLKKHGCCYF